MITLLVIIGVALIAIGGAGLILAVVRESDAEDRRRHEREAE